MTDPKIGKQPQGVSKSVYDSVSSIVKEEGNKRRVDTKAEYNK